MAAMRQPEREKTGLLARYVPIIHWLSHYNKNWLTGDIVAGLSVWALMVPQCLGFAVICGVPVQCGLYAAAIQVDKNTVSLSLAELALDHPQLTLSANLALTETTPPLSLEVKGTEIDVAATRQTALALSGKNDVVKDIFDIVKGGRIPVITLTAQGTSLSDLGNMINMVIRGQMRNGEISIPDIRLDLKDTAGEVVISRGILEGRNLQAHLGNSLGQNGKLKLGLIGDVAPFHLETDLRADLSELPPILKRLVNDKDFQKELALLKELKGSADGKLVLGEDTNNVKVKVDASNIQLSAHYGRLPHPLQISDGNFSYDENRIGVRQLRASWESPLFQSFRAAWEWIKTNHINYVRNGEKTISADLAIQDGLKISTDLVLGSDKLVVKKLFNQDKASRATMGISVYNDIITLSFKGNLHKSTLDQLTTGNQWLAGWLEGDVNAHINRKQPLKSAVWGRLKGKEIIYPWKPDIPLKINDVAVTKDQQLNPAKTCLMGGTFKADGTYNLHGQPMTVTSAGEHDLQNGRFVIR